MAASLIAREFDRAKLIVIADGLAAAVAASLPWSVSATSILLVAWLIVLVPTLSLSAVRQEGSSAAGGIPVLFWLLALVGTLWADASFTERLGGLELFWRFLVIPLLMAQFRRSQHGDWVLNAFFASCVALLALSWLSVFWPGLPWRMNSYGVPVKDYISQSGVFALCVFGLAHCALAAWREGRVSLSAVCVLLAVVFLLNIFYIATSRTTLVTIPILFLFFGLRSLGWKATIGFAAAAAILLVAIWWSSPYLQQRVLNVSSEIHSYQTHNAATSTGERLEFWKKSLSFIASAPIFGHGTGSINPLFRSAVSGSGASKEAAANPHNQTLAVGIQLGLIGVILLYAMWLAHGFLFWQRGFPAWIGTIVVIQNVVGSIFNSHLFDFTQGWIYVIGVGVMAGMVRRPAIERDISPVLSPATAERP